MPPPWLPRHPGLRPDQGPEEPGRPPQRRATRGTPQHDRTCGTSDRPRSDAENRRDDESPTIKDDGPNVATDGRICRTVHGLRTVPACVPEADIVKGSLT